MPGTITDDNRAKSKVLAENLCLEKSGRNRNSSGLTATNGQLNFSTKPALNILLTVPKFVALLVFAASIGSGERVDAGYVDLDCRVIRHSQCRNTSITLHPDTLSCNMYTEKRRGYLTSGPGSWYGNYNIGDYIDTRCNCYVDKGKYYYICDVHYKLLGGPEKRLGHHCYPKLFERWPEHRDGARGIIGMSWTAFYQLRFYAPIGHPVNYYICPVCCEPIVVSSHLRWISYSITGDNIDILKDRDLDKKRFKIFYGTQYTCPSGIGYRHKSFLWYPYIFCYTHDFQHSYIPNCLITDPLVSTTSIPEPATIGFLLLGGIGLSIFRNKKSHTNQA